MEIFGNLTAGKYFRKFLKTVQYNKSNLKKKGSTAYYSLKAILARYNGAYDWNFNSDLI